MSGGQVCGACMATSDSGMALKPCARSDCPQAKERAAFAALFSPLVLERERMAIGPYQGRPKGSNADEWHLYLSENLNALPMVAVQIAEAIEEAERRATIAQSSP